MKIETSLNKRRFKVSKHGQLIESVIDQSVYACVEFSPRVEPNRNVATDCWAFREDDFGLPMNNTDLIVL